MDDRIQRLSKYMRKINNVEKGDIRLKIISIDVGKALQKVMV